MSSFFKKVTGAATDRMPKSGGHDPAMCAECPLYQANTCCLLEPGGRTDGTGNPLPESGLRATLTMHLEPGTYLWCSCGLSQDQPLCDGSHIGRCCEPVKFEIKHAKAYRLCGCKQTRSPPFCDGHHDRCS
jgi:CDGSH-type Zn-finger protein